MGDAPPRRILALPQKHYCNLTILSVGDVGPDGLPIEKLLRCSRCQETYYCGIVQQRRHWKLHKFVCRPARAEVTEESFAGLSMGGVAEAIKVHFYRLRVGSTTQDLVRETEWGRPFLFLLKRLQILCYEEPDTELLEQDYAAAESTLGCMECLFRVSDSSIEVLWAIPGMTTFLLNLELMSTAMRERKLAAALPSDEELRNPVANDIAVTASGCVFVKMVYRILTPSCWELGGVSLQLRKTAIATSAVRKMMQLYADPYTRASLPLDVDASPRNNILPGFLGLLLDDLPDDPLNSAAIVPGLTAHEMFQIIVTEPFYHRCVGLSSLESLDETVTFKRLRQSVSAKPKAWEAFSVEARASTAHNLLGLYNQLDSKAKYTEPDTASWTTVAVFVKQIFFLVLGFDSITKTKADATWLKVVVHAATAELRPFAGVFSDWYRRVGSKAVRMLELLATETKFSLDLVPPPVVEHIVEYAMDPFGSEPLMAIPFLLASQGKSSPI